MVTGYGAPRRRRVGTSSMTALAAFLLVAVVAVPVGAGASMRGVRVSSPTVWLCRPGQRPDPCAYPRAATTVIGSGATSVSTSSSTLRSAQKFDCFYVYPTVSTEKTNNANLAVQPAELAAAASQASRFSQVCRVWAPMYRQATVYALSHGAFTSASVSNTAYVSLLSGWRDYIRHDNDGRPIVFIGHSQGAAMLIRLLRTQIDPSPALRKQLVSAIILGGNVQVPTVGASAGASNTSRRVPRPPRPAVSSPIRPLAPPHLARPFRASRAWGEHPVGANDADWSTGGLCQSGDLLERDRAVAALLPRLPAPRCRASP